MAFTGNEDHRIDIDTARVMTRRFRDTAVEDIVKTKGGFFGKTRLQAILDQNNCVGLRYYFALESDLKLKVVLVGTDADENDITTGLLAEYSVMCPQICGVDNPLNSNF